MIWHVRIAYYQHMEKIMGLSNAIIAKHVSPSLLTVRNHNSSPWFVSLRDELFKIRKELGAERKIEKH